MKEENLDFNNIGIFEEIKITHILKTLNDIKNEKQLLIEVDSLVFFY